MQLADGLAHPAHRSFKFKKLGQAIPNDYGAFLARLLKRKIYDRSPVNGKIEGYGKKWLP